MAEPKIEKQQTIERDKQIKLRPFLVAGIPILILLLAVVLSFAQGLTPLGKVSRDKWYDATSSLADDEGFVGKSNKLFSILLEDVDTSVEATCLDSLNKRYRALEFALPYGEEHKEVIEAADLRLVGIHPERIADDELRRFYFNSRLPQLINRQDEQRGETYFRLDCVGKNRIVDGVRPLEIRSIRLIPSMFKVSLAKNPWSGIITGAKNCLFSDSSNIYLTYGNSVLPLRNEQELTRQNQVQFRAIMSDGTLLSTNGPINYYNYYRQAFKNNDPHSVRIELRQHPQSQNEANFVVSYSNDMLLVGHNTDLMVVGDGKYKTYPGSDRGSQRPDSIPFKDGMKLIVYDGASHKLGEFSFQRSDPSRLLSCLVQSSTGMHRFTISDTETDLFTQQMLRGLSRHLSNRDNIAQVDLSIDPMLSKEFETEIRGYLPRLRDRINNDTLKPTSQVNEQYDMSVTIMDMATGDVLATPFYTSLFDHEDYPDLLRLTTRNTSLSRRSIGSTFKPMLALAAVQTTPALLDMNTSNPHRYSVPSNWEDPRATVTFFGRTTKPWAENSKSHWSGCNFTEFLSHSDDVYPVALAALAMTNQRVDANVTMLPLNGTQNFFEVDRRGLLKFKRDTVSSHADLRQNYFPDWLSYLYNTNYDREIGTDLNLFSHLFESSLDDEQKMFGLEEISPELTSLRMDRFYDGDDFHDRLVPWVLGQGDNMWNSIKVAEAWCRMIGKYAVNASFIKHRTDSVAPSLIQEGEAYPGSTLGRRSITAINDTWNAFLDRLHNAQSQGTLLGNMRDRVVALNNAEHCNLVLLSKTGTPDAYSRYEFPLLGGRNRFVDVGMYSFALLDNDQYTNRIRQNRPGHGIVCVVRITRSYICRQCRPGHQCNDCKRFWGLKSEHARNFFSNNSGRIEKLYEMTRDYYN